MTWPNSLLLAFRLVCTFDEEAQCPVSDVRLLAFSPICHKGATVVMEGGCEVSEDRPFRSLVCLQIRATPWLTACHGDLPGDDSSGFRLPMCSHLVVVLSISPGRLFFLRSASAHDGGAVG